MTNSQKVFLGIIIIVVIALGWAYFMNKNVVVYEAPVAPEVSKDKVYQDMMTDKCYNEEEVEQPCKG